MVSYHKFTSPLHPKNPNSLSDLIHAHCEWTNHSALRRHKTHMILSLNWIGNNCTWVCVDMAYQE